MTLAQLRALRQEAEGKLAVGHATAPPTARPTSPTASPAVPSSVPSFAGSSVPPSAQSNKRPRQSKASKAGSLSLPPHFQTTDLSRVEKVGAIVIQGLHIKKESLTLDLHLFLNNLNQDL